MITGAKCDNCGAKCRPGLYGRGDFCRSCEIESELQSLNCELEGHRNRHAEKIAEIQVRMNALQEEQRTLFLKAKP